MNIQTTVRRLLPLTLACGLLAVAAPAAHAQLAANGRTFTPPEKTLQPTPEDKAAGAGAIASDVNCGDLLVVITGTAGSVARVSCDHGYFEGTLPSNNAIVSGQPAVLLFEQSVTFGPDCTITVSGGSNTAVLAVQQNFCAAKAGQITASVVSGSATLNGTAQGSFGDSLPGIVWFTTGF